MGERTKTAPGTEEHRAPEPLGTESAEPALILAFPHPAALPLPPAGEAVGREWLARHGVEDSRVSSGHVVFTRAAGSLFLADAGSRNGTWVDGERLSPGDRAKLSDGAVIRIGRKVLVYRDELRGPREASPQLGELIGPFGLRRVEESMIAVRLRPPRCVLIEGETGTGKELVAGALAQLLRPSKPYVAVNVAGIAAGVFESQLFGHVAGAFSGAGKGSRGIIASHDGGTVFLDEIGELPLELQPKLLRLLENGESLPVGADRPSRVDVLVVGATNRDLEEMTEARRFRRDRPVSLRSSKRHLARERAEDLFAIAALRAAKMGETYTPDRVEVEAVERLMLHPWRANVRELHSVLDRIAAIDLAACSYALRPSPSSWGDAFPTHGRSDTGAGAGRARRLCRESERGGTTARGFEGSATTVLEAVTVAVSLSRLRRSRVPRAPERPLRGWVEVERSRRAERSRSRIARRRQVGPETPGAPSEKRRSRGVVERTRARRHL
ncbi:MAG: sigma-54-dependent Fis family transcriptional regulator [Polyangiaceae bacterium]